MEQSFARNLLYGVISASVAQTILTPIEKSRIRIRTPIEPQKIIPKDIFYILRLAATQQGIFSHWKGNMDKLTRYVPPLALTFSLKDLCNSYFQTLGTNQVLNGLASGGIAGASAFALFYPLDSARNILMRKRRLGDKEATLTGVIKQMCQKKEWGSLYRF